jgi:hypothetical protein
MLKKGNGFKELTNGRRNNRLHMEFKGIDIVWRIKKA